jgi:hypothetical protein
MMVLDVPGLEGAFVPPAAQVAVWLHGRIMMQELPALNSSAQPSSCFFVTQHVQIAGAVMEYRQSFTAVNASPGVLSGWACGILHPPSTYDAMFHASNP